MPLVLDVAYYKGRWCFGAACLANIVQSENTTTGLADALCRGLSLLVDEDVLPG